MRVMRCVFVATLVTALSLPMVGCGFLATQAGVERDENGKVHINQGSPMDVAQNLALGLGPWGIAAATVIGLAKRAIRHREVIAAGQRDDDYDGIPDDQQAPKA